MKDIDGHEIIKDEKVDLTGYEADDEDDDEVTLNFCFNF